MSHYYILAEFYAVKAWQKDTEVMFSVAHCLLLCVAYPADHFKEICPAGHGYTYSRSVVQVSLGHRGEDDVQSTGVSWEEQSHIYPQPPSSHPSLLLPFGPQHPSYPQTPQVPQYPEYLETPQAPQHPLTPQQPLHPSQPARETPEQWEGENKMFGKLNLCQVDLKVGKCLFWMAKTWIVAAAQCSVHNMYLSHVFIQTG